MKPSLRRLTFLLVHVFFGLARRQLRLKSDNASAVANSAGFNQLKAYWPFYHSTDDIHRELVALAGRCPSMQIRSVEGVGMDGSRRTIDVINVGASGVSVNKNFMLFGEHARELISAESGLHFVKTLCGETHLSSKAASVLQSNEFEIVVNGNPGSRRSVELGNFCLRVNPNGVDLNRNWDEKWEPQPHLAPHDTNPGSAPFSEPETRVFKKLVENYKPSMFLTVHSGTKGMYMPWAYDMHHLAKRNQQEMMQILRDLDAEHCQCPFGAAGKEVGYACPGTCLDWVYDHLRAAYSFAFEIYTTKSHDAQLKQRWQEKMARGGAFWQDNAHLGHQHYQDLFAEHPSCFVQHSHKQLDGKDMNSMDCFRTFNPDSEIEYHTVMENWSDAYLELASKVTNKIRMRRASEPPQEKNTTGLA
jgi:hypothetical protein